MDYWHTSLGVNGTALVLAACFRTFRPSLFILDDRKHYSFSNTCGYGFFFTNVYLLGDNGRNRPRLKNMKYLSSVALFFIIILLNGCGDSKYDSGYESGYYSGYDNGYADGHADGRAGK